MSIKKSEEIQKKMIKKLKYRQQEIEAKIKSRDDTLIEKVNF